MRTEMRMGPRANLWPGVMNLRSEVEFYFPIIFNV
jgi:hypothetical protein